MQSFENYSAFIVAVYTVELTGGKTLNFALCVFLLQSYGLSTMYILN